MLNCYCADVPLTMDHMKMLFETLKKARDKLYFIGKEIGVTDADLQEIEDRHLPDKARCMLEMMKGRLQEGELTLTLLCKSLRSKNVKRDDLALEIEGLHLTSSDTCKSHAVTYLGFYFQGV